MKICKYAFLILEKGDKQKIAPGFLKFVSMLFLIFKKGDKQKIAPGFLKFKSMLFNLIIFQCEKELLRRFEFVCMLFINIVTFKKLLL